MKVACEEFAVDGDGLLESERKLDRNTSRDGGGDCSWCLDFARLILRISTRRYWSCPLRVERCLGR